MDEPSEPARGETRVFWETAIRLWEESGLAVRDFCRREGLAESTFHAWRHRFRSEASTCPSDAGPSTVAEHRPPRKSRRLRRPAEPSDAAARKAAAVEFLPVRVIAGEASRGSTSSPAATTRTVPIEVVLASPWHVRILPDFDPATLDAVLAVLERRRC